MQNATNTLCWLMLVFLLISVGSLPSFAQDEHTVLLYTFESGAGKVVKDLSGNGNDGELMGPKWGEGNPGGGLTFGGNAPRDFVEIPDSEAWIWLRVSPSKCGSTLKGQPLAGQAELAYLRWKCSEGFCRNP